MASHFQGTFSTSSTSPGPLAFYYFNSISFFISTCLLGTNQLHSSDTHSDTNMTQSGLSSVNTLLTEPSPAERYAFIPKLAACHREFPAFQHPSSRFKMKQSLSPYGELQQVKTIPKTRKCPAISLKQLLSDDEEALQGGNTHPGRRCLAQTAHSTV